jgi:hypothetical protein
MFRSGHGATLFFWRHRRVMFMKQEKLTVILSAIGVVEGTLSLLIAVLGTLAALFVATFLLGVLAGVFITCYVHAREDSKAT